MTVPLYTHTEKSSNLTKKYKNKIRKRLYNKCGLQTIAHQHTASAQQSSYKTFPHKTKPVCFLK